MPAPKLLAGLPKPLLFGLYGAIGGLLGAILFGEPAWHFLKPPPPPPPEPQLAVSSAATVTLYPGTSNTFAVKVARGNFTGPVTIKFEKLPDGVSIDPITIPADQDGGEATVTAAKTTKVEKKPPVTVAASGEGVSASASIEVEVIAIPPPPPAIALAIPTDLNIYKRGTSKFTATVARREYNGPVNITVAPLPPGVTMAPVTIPPGGDRAEVVLSAGDAAELGTVSFEVVAEAPGKKDLVAREKASMKVEKPPIAPVDVVFVLDVTASMQWAIDDLKNGIAKFTEKLAKEQIPFRLALVTFQDLTVAGETVEVVRFKNADGEESPFTASAAIFRDKLTDLKARGGGDIPESSLEALVEAAKLPFRPGASRMVLLITDAPPKVRPGGPTIDTVVRLMKGGDKAMQDAGVDSVHIVVQELDLEVYKPLLAAGTGKPTTPFDLKNVVLEDDGFDVLLGTFGEAVAAAAVARAPDTKPTVAPPPAPPSIAAATNTATPKGTEAPPPPSVKGVQSSGQFAAGTEGQLTLAIGVWTGCIAALVCLFLLGGQHHYLRGSLPGIGGALLGVLGGLIVGLVGGAAGQGLFFLAPESAVLAHLFRVFGWAILGALAGAGLSFFVPNMKWTLGLAGGAIGGAAGAAGFIAVTGVTGDLIGRIVGGLILGFCIGLMVAIVEAAFRRAWLEVRFGERELVTVTLGPEPVKIGGDSRACTVWARGAPAIAVRFFVREGKVICDDTLMGREAAVGDGYEKDVGNVRVTVRTGSGAAPPTPTRAVPPPRPAPKPAAMSLDDDDGFDLPMPVKSSAPPVAPAPAKPQAPAPPPATSTPPKPPVPAAAKPPAAPAAAPAPPRPPAPAAPPTKLPVPSAAPVRPSAPISSSKPAMPGLPAPPAPAKPPVAPPPAPPAAKPTIKAGARDPNACPGCGRVVAGSPGTRYCMVCDQSF